MGWIAWTLIIYAAIGMVIALAVLAVDWYHGEDILVGDLGNSLVRMVIWPTILLVIPDLARESGLSHRLVLRGRSSARNTGSHG